jgi:hypothetical protein
LSALLYRWRKRFADGPRSGFPALAEVSVDTGAPRDAAVEIETAGLWPRVRGGTMHLSAAQLAALIEGLDWTRVHTIGARTPRAVV